MVHNYLSWYENHYHELTGYGIWLRGNEPNTISAEQFDNALLSVLICRLSTSWDVADSYTHKMLYEIIAGIDGVYPDLSFLPPQRDAVLMFDEQVPWLIGTTTKHSGLHFDVIAFSNSIIQELINLPIMLEKSGIPLSKRERCADDDLPLIIVGGANALFTSALLGDDPVVDGIFVGESSELITRLFTTVRDLKKQNRPKNDILTQLESIPGFFQPDKKTHTTKYSPIELEPGSLPGTPPLLYITDQPGRARIPISEGCPCFCSFCAESWSRKPYRELAPEAVRKAALNVKAAQGAESIELYSFNFSMHSSFYSILQDMASLFSTVKVSSQRFDYIAEDPSLLHYLHAIGKSTFTCGLEGISERLRRYLHKSLDENRLRSSLSYLIRSPIRELKIFLIATGKETEDDYNEFRKFLTGINDMMQSAGRKPRILFSMTPLVRFPYTPLESEDAVEPSVYHTIIHQVERLVRCRGMEFRISADINDYLLSQIMVRAAGPEILSACIGACRTTGFVYYRYVDESFVHALTTIFKEKTITIAQMLGGWSSDGNNRVPVSIGVDESFLQQSGKMAVDFEDKGHCMGTFTEAAPCRGCGACDNEEDRLKLNAQKERNAPSLEKFRTMVKNVNSQLEQIDCLVTVDHSKRGIPRGVLGAMIARAFMQTEPGLIKLYRKYNGSHNETKFETSWITGDDCVSLHFSSGALSVINSRSAFLEKVNGLLSGWGTISRFVGSDAVFNHEIIMTAPYSTDPSVYCSMHQLKYTQLKNGDGSYRYQFTPQACKKQDIRALTLWNHQGHSRLVIQTGDKFKFDQFLENSFTYPSPECKIRVIVVMKLTE